MTLYEETKLDGTPGWALNDAEKLRRQLRFRCWHRGTKEVDILLGGFVDRHLQDLALERMHEMAALLECPDNDIYSWVIGREEPDPDYDTELMALLRSHVKAAK